MQQSKHINITNIWSPPSPPLPHPPSSVIILPPFLLYVSFFISLFLIPLTFLLPSPSSVSLIFILLFHPVLSILSSHSLYPFSPLTIVCITYAPLLSFLIYFPPVSSTLLSSLSVPFLLFLFLRFLSICFSSLLLLPSPYQHLPPFYSSSLSYLRGTYSLYSSSSTESPCTLFSHRLTVCPFLLSSFYLYSFSSPHFSV